MIKDDLNLGKNKLIEIIKSERYFGFKDYFYITFGSHNDTDCAFIVINDKISLCVVEKNGNITCVGADEISGGEWYDIEDNMYIKECLNNIYLALA